MIDTVTSDPDSGPNPLTYARSTASAPSGGTVTFGTPTSEDTTATFNIAGSYTLRLTADDSTDTAVGDITITVSTRVTYSIAGQTVAVANNGTLTWILGDHQGSTSTAITAGQTTTIRYNPYGTQRGTPTSALPTDRTYTGQTADPTTGLMYYRARYYNPAVGQFTQPDTATQPGPPGLNRYSYTNGNPIGFTDPTGHLPGMNPNTVKEERGYFAGIQAWGYGDVEGAYRSCIDGCYERHNDSIAHAAVFYRGANFDDGKHNDGKIDGDIRKGDFQAIAENRHGDAAAVDQWAAKWLLDRDQYDGYGDNRSGFEKVGGWVADNWTYLAAAAVCVGTGLAGCGVAMGLGFAERTRQREGLPGTLQPWTWSSETVVDGLVTGTFFYAGALVTAPVSAAAGEASTVPNVTIRVGQGSVVASNVFVAGAGLAPNIACTSYAGPRNGVCG